MLVLVVFATGCTSTFPHLISISNPTKTVANLDNYLDFSPQSSEHPASETSPEVLSLFKSQNRSSSSDKKPNQLVGFQQDPKVDGDQTGPKKSQDANSKSNNESSRRKSSNLDDQQIAPNSDYAPNARTHSNGTPTDGGLYNDRNFNNGSPLGLSDVLQSLENCYPEIQVAVSELEAANGKVLSTWGEFDTLISAHSISQPLGFYKTYRNGVGFNRPLYGGGEIYGTYRIGDGNFEDWYGERETNEGGEFKAGFSLPLLKNREIDQRRADQNREIARRNQVDANIGSRLLQFERFATQAYWDWVTAGQVVEIQLQLLKLAQLRVGNIDTRIRKGDLAKIAKIDNDRFIAARKNDLIKARRQVEKAAIKLSLFLRDQGCEPLVVTSDRLPQMFPEAFQISVSTRDRDIASAMSVRPEIAELNFMRNEAFVDLQYAQNLTLTKIDFKGFAGQDIGGAASSKGDKTPFELQLGVLAEVPFQRREGRGKIQAAQAKLSQVDAKLKFVGDKIRAEIQDASSAVNAAYDQIQQSTKNLELTRQSLELAKTQFETGDIDLIALNIYETAVADAQLKLLEAQFKYFFYRAIYKTALGRR